MQRDKLPGQGVLDVKPHQTTTHGLRAAPMAAVALLALLLGSAAAAAPESETESPWVWQGVSRVLAIGDVHGNHDKLVRLLTAAGLIDDEQRWGGGDSHLVVAGDFLDRGLDDRPLMDLLRRLEVESAAAGGRAHVLLGNHEVMNLFRDLRYVNPNSYRHFKADELKADRKAAIGKFVRMRGADNSSARFRSFNKAFPPGYFGRLRSLDPDGEYGSWLLGLPVIVKINGIVYLHGGLNEDFAALGVDGINRRVAAQVQRYLEARRALESEGIVLSVMSYPEVRAAAQKAADTARGKGGAAKRRAAEALLAAGADPILGGDGPLWYRGNALQDERLERDTLGRALELLGATAMVVAHSPTRSERITSRFHGRLFRIDHNLGGCETPLALVAEEGETLVLDSATGETTSPEREFPLGQFAVLPDTELSDREMQGFLAQAPVIAVRTLGRGGTRPQLVALEAHGEVRRGIFKTVGGDGGTDRYQHEVAAYLLDRALGLGMVPVTVLRTLDGQPGSLQTWVEGALDQETAEGYNMEFFKTAGKTSQLSLAHVFDALIGNTDRKPADVLGLVNRDQVMLIDHSKAFSTSPELPPGLAPIGPMPASMAEALESLDRQSVERQLGKLLSEAQIEALFERRDKILARVAGPVKAAS